MKRVIAGIAAAAALAAGTTVALASGETRSQVENQAIAIYNKANTQVGRRSACRPKPQPATLTHGAPSQALLSTLSILRRPATPEDALPEQEVRFFDFAQGIYADYVRVAHAADGRSYQIVAAKDALAFPPQPQSCIHELHVRILRLLKGKSRRVRRRALHFFQEAARNNRRLETRTPREGVFVFSYANGHIGGGGGGTGVEYIRTHGMFGSSGTRDGSAVVDGLIPDGVATVTSFFSRKASRGPEHRPKVYPKAIKRTDPVQDNMVSFSVARDAEDAFPAKMIWRAADGSIVRVVRERE